VLALLRDHAAGGGAVIMITADAGEVAGVSDRVLELRSSPAPDSNREPWREGSAPSPATCPEGPPPSSAAGREWPPPSGPARGGLKSRTAPVLDLAGVTHCFDTGGGCRDVDLQVQAGELVGLVGPNGSGKSTLARQILGLTRPQSGRVIALGDSPAGRGGAALRRRMGVVLQDPDLRICRSSLVEELALDAQIRGRSQTEARAWSRRLLEDIGLADWADEHPLRLSRGQRRLATVASACSLGAEFILTDEPTAGLSAAQSAAVYRGLRACADGGAAVLAISHDHAGLWEVADRVLRMEDGVLATAPVAAPAPLPAAGAAASLAAASGVPAQVLPAAAAIR
jgi:energy-coupling factor transport system ATP-binding protein